MGGGSKLESESEKLAEGDDGEGDDDGGTPTSHLNRGPDYHHRHQKRRRLAHFEALVAANKITPSKSPDNKNQQRLVIS